MAEIVQSGRDPEAVRGERARRVRRLVLPTLIVLLIVVGALGSAWISWRTSSEGARDVARAYVEVVDLRVRDRVAGYFSPAEKAAEVIAASMRSGGLGRWERRQFDRVSRSYLRAYPQLLNVYIGSSNGSFMMLTRLEGGGYARKTIWRDEETGERRVTVETLDANAQAIETRETPEDAYDPRTRPWFEAALAADRPYWTSIYRFYTADSLGFTVAQKLETEQGEDRAVVGVDLLLRDLETFLDGLPLGEGGMAFVIDGEGRFVAPPPEARSRGDAAESLHVEDVESEEVRAVYDRFRIEKEYRGQFRVLGDWRLVSFSSLEISLGRDWWLIFSIPESALVGFVADATFWSLVAALVVVLLSAALLGVVAWQSRQTERKLAQIDRDNERLRHAEDAYAELARVAAGPDPARALRAATEIAARATGARRVGIWRLEEAEGLLVCIDRYDQGIGGHAAGDRLTAARCPGLFDRLSRAQPLAVLMADREVEPAAAELVAHYLEDAGIETLLGAPVLAAGRAAGWVWIEDPGERSAPTVDAAAFAEALAGLVAGAMGRARPDEAVAASSSGGRLPEGCETGGVAPLVDRRRAARTRAFAERGLAASAIEGAALDGVAVAVMEFHDAPSLAVAAEPGGPTLLDRAVAVATGAGSGEPPVAYARLEGRRLVLADDGDGDPARAAERVAGLALDLQEEVAAASRATGRRRDRRRLASIGLDLGDAFAARVGEDGVFNLWGGAVDLAGLLAASAVEDRVLATEPAARAARERFASQRRGGFFAEGIGEIDVHLVQARR